MGLTTVIYVIFIRPALIAADPAIFLAEFPITIALVVLVLWVALRRGRGTEDLPEAPMVWQRHVQVIHTLPDPERSRLRAALDAWASGGTNIESAATVLARLDATDAKDLASRADALAREMSAIGGPRRRLTFLRDHAKRSRGA